ncbi:Cys/Met metabolism PLP-dependent enzyme-domain-containing protein [Crepidotus variabilis]|uniref:Cys/Met metabolism PLP-dependent enzyme-domain-containing protein n=1 Tax=Crepidotus variabilis TaxID=179855 RepID=A0A9P6ETD4_9AGAR|nr:Cys/Met metabolism PLP-dependent enzyme-domain-containing protein [Crepidotus variabilis]
MPPSRKLSGTTLVHGDQGLTTDANVAPSISVSTTFRAAPTAPNQSRTLQDFDWRQPSHHVYSRWSQQITTRAEHVLSKINHGFAITYASGLAAGLAALFHFQPKRIAIRGGYPGFFSIFEILQRSNGSKPEIIDLDDPFQPGDFCWLETPLNPTGESRDIAFYANKIHEVNGKLLVDSTFAPPPLQYPFDLGADCVLHSGSKYFGGHSDLLCGVLIVQTEPEWKQLHLDRSFLGNMMGSLESWLLLRSLRTLHLRVAQQSATATALAQWLNAIVKTPHGHLIDNIPGGIVAHVSHSSIQGIDERGFDPHNQMIGGWNATFSLKMSTPKSAKQLPHLLKYFTPATSLGGVESLIEYRHEIDPSADPCLVRLSIGLEDFEDLKRDLSLAFQKLAQPRAKL